MTQQTPTIEYEVRDTRAPGISWTLASTAVLLALAPMVEFPLIIRMSPPLSHKHALQLITSLAGASGVGAVVCGILGRHQATQSNLPIARWLAIIGILLGATTLLGMIGITAIVKYYK